MQKIIAFCLGGVFSLGLMISGMSNPQKVINFLDLFGNWDASLAFVMGGAILVAIVPFQKAVRQNAPKTLFQETMQLPDSTKIDRRLIVGSLIFGAGWGIAGICPAPALTLIGLHYWQGGYFILAMLAGMWGYEQWVRFVR